MVLGLKPMRKLVTSKRNIKELDRTKVFHGPRTQTCGETSYYQEISKY